MAFQQVCLSRETELSDGTGANLTASVALLYRDDKNEPPLTGLYLSIPSLLSPGVVPEKYQKDFRSRDENKDAPILGQGALDMFRSKCIELVLGVADIGRTLST